MKLTISKDEILQGLQKVQPVVSSRTTLPILSNVLLRAEKDMLWLTTTDLEVSVRTGCNAKVSRKGATTLPVRTLFSIIRELNANEVALEVDETHHASLESGASFFKIVGIAEDEFPPMPEFEAGRSYTLDQGVFKEMLRNSAYAASSDETRYILNGVLMSFKGDKLTVVATDGRRLALVEQEVEFPKDAEIDLVVPSKTVDELVKNLGDEGTLKIQASETQISFEFDGVLVVSKLIDGQYPNFRQVIPASSEHRITLEREQLQNAVRRVALLTSDKSNSIRLTFGKNLLVISAVTPELGEARENIPIKYSGKEVAIAFNPDFVVAPLKHITSDEVYFEMTDELSPGIIKCDIPFLYVLMPMRIS